MSDLDEQARKLAAAIAGLEAQRAALGDAVVEPALAALRQQMSELEAASVGSDATDERKLVTIVFADISGFTALSETLDPEDVRELINACFGCLVPVIQKYGGTIDKFIGDEIMALFGAPVAHEDDAERALQAALEMMDALRGFNHSRGTRLGLHMGVNTGRVIAGRVGVQGRQDYSVMGDTVNLAARLKDASVSGQIFAGPTTYRQTAPLFDFEKIPPLNLKGKKKPIDGFRLRGRKSVTESLRGIAGLSARLVGRDAEMRQLQALMGALEVGRGSVLTITGEAGLGKSRLLSEARKSLPAGFAWAEGRALSYTSGMDYWLARGLLCDLAGLRPNNSLAEMAEALRGSVEAILGDRVREVFPYLARLLDLQLAGEMAERVKFVSAETLQARMLDAFREYVRARGTRQPLVLVWEDLHWCDPSSLGVLQALLPLTREIPLLIMIASRPDEEGPGDAVRAEADRCGLAYQEMQLSPLNREQSDSLIQQLLRLENVPERLCSEILQRAEGNPFFLEELLRSLIEAGVVATDKMPAETAGIFERLEIPDTVEGVLTARIDRLAPEKKQTLQKASVIGRMFQKRVLQHLHDSPFVEERLGLALSELEHREFIQSCQEPESEAPGPGEEYMFRHAITHDVAYNSLLQANRKALHAMVARALERLFPDRVEELSATLGYHFGQAEMSSEAAHYLGRAGERAKATFANAEAVTFYRSAFAHLEKIEIGHRALSTNALAARLQEGLGDVLSLIGQQPEARLAFERARFFLSEADAIGRSRLYRKTAFSHNVQRHYEETGRALDAAEEELGEPDAQGWEEMVQVQLERMHLLYWQGMAVEMRELAGKYRRAVEERGTPGQRGRFFQMLALSHLTGSRYRPSEECLKLAEMAFSESQGAENLSEVAHIRFVLGFVHLWRGNFVEAVEHGEKALHMAERIGDLTIQARCLTYLTVAYRGNDRLEEARQYAARTLHLATTLEMVEYIAMAKANLAWVAWREKQDAIAKEFAHDALELWHGMDDPYGFDWMALWPLIGVALEENDLPAAIGYLGGLVADGQHPLAEQLMEAVQKAISLMAAGDTERARESAGQALMLARQLHYA